MSLRLLFCIVFLGVFLTFCTSYNHKTMSCKKVKKLSVEERHKNYPYNKTSRIAAVSFKNDYKKLTEEEQIGVVEKEEFDADISIYVGVVMEKYFDILKEDFSRLQSERF